jgi:hypothetical protein
MERDSDIVSGVETLSGNVNEGVRLPVLVKEEKSLGVDGKMYIADALYDNKDNHVYLKEGGKGAIIPDCYRRKISFTFKFKEGIATCSCGKVSSGRTRESEGWLYYFSTKDCMECKFRERCLKEGERRK